MIADQYEDLQLVLPWHLSCDIACKALINSRTFDEQTAEMTKSGMVRYETMRQRYLTMKKANREAEANLTVVKETEDD